MGSLFASIICFIACHGGPADHFATFTEGLSQKGYEVQVYATGPALKKFQDRHIEAVPFFLEGTSKTKIADDLAEKCKAANIVVTDVGHIFDISLQRALAKRAPLALRLAYYDNPESYVPGGYSATAAKVMRAAQGVLFANANLAVSSIFQAHSKTVRLAKSKKIGIGYYPKAQAEKIAQRRMSERAEIRSRFFSQHGLKDRGQKILVYAGGNNEEYFSKAFPSLIQFLHEASIDEDLSHFIIVLQQHPGAKEKNIDGNLISRWISERSQDKPPHFLLSEFNSDDAQVLADAVLYYQTSMGPQFVLSGIPTIQVGHTIYEDILVRNGLCLTAVNGQELKQALLGMSRSVARDGSNTAIDQGLGIRSDWATRLETVMQQGMDGTLFAKKACVKSKYLRSHS